MKIRDGVPDQIRETVVWVAGKPCSSVAEGVYKVRDAKNAMDSKEILSETRIMDEHAINAYLATMRRQFPSLPVLRDFQVIFSNFQSQ